MLRPGYRHLRLGRAPHTGEDGQLARLVYASTSVIARAQGHFRSELADIMAACERNNPRAGITGLLVYDRGRFIQLLEGPQGRLKEIYGRICEDTRHTDITALLEEPASERLFEAWAMAFANAGDAPLPASARSDWNDLDRHSLLSRLTDIHDRYSVMNFRPAAQER